MDFEIDEKIDAENVAIFKKYGVKKPEELRHTCVYCKQKCSIGDSSSECGHGLLCNRCKTKLFVDPQNFWDWRFRKA